jgi:hypothetical protein
MRLPSFGSNPKSEYGMTLGISWFSILGALFSVILFEAYRLVRWARKRLK